MAASITVLDIERRLFSNLQDSLQQYRNGSVFALYPDKVG
jgi:hypothetical protein